MGPQYLPRRMSAFVGAQVPKVSLLSKRIHGWNWQSFPISMGTSAVYVTLSSLKNHPDPVTTIELMFFFLNLVLFLINTCLLLLQLILYPTQSKRLVMDPVKGMFVGLVVLSFATIIIGYGVLLGKIIHPEFIFDLFWVYIAFAILVCVPMIMIWFNGPHDLAHFTPASMFIVFPLMLTGVVGFNVLRVLPPQDTKAVTVLFVSLYFQGLGTLITFLYLGIYLLRIMTTGFLHGHQANGAFVACGPPGFTALALINLGARAREILPIHGLIAQSAGEVWFSVCILGAIMLLGLASLFFVIGFFPWYFKVHRHLKEILGMWALTFPIGFKALGDILNSQFLWTVHAVFTTVICLLWLVLFSLTCLALYKGLILNSPDSDVWRDWVGGGLATVAISPAAPPAPQRKDEEAGYPLPASYPPQRHAPDYTYGEMPQTPPVAAYGAGQGGGYRV